MTLIQLLLLQIIAHLIGDFIFQPDEKAKDKNVTGFKSEYLKYHVLIIFILSWLLSFQLMFIFAAFAIAVSHWILDGIKKHFNQRFSRYAFFIDQTVHLILIGFIVFTYDCFFEIKPIFDIAFNKELLLIITGYIICLKPANVFIKETFIAFNIDISDIKKEELENAGKLIGIIERIIVITFILLKQFEAVGFLIAAKSILRFKIDNTKKTEYVLIGTLLSFGIAIAIGIAIILAKSWIISI